jgi:hypothetical protein
MSAIDSVAADHLRLHTGISGSRTVRIVPRTAMLSA